MLPLWRLLIEVLSAFIITGGSTLTGYMVGQNSVTLPSKAALLVGLIAGAIAAANQARAFFAQPPA